MIRYVNTVVALFVIALGAWAQNSVPHQHSVAPSNLIDGSKNPELIPDSTAYRLYLLNASIPANSAIHARLLAVPAERLLGAVYKSFQHLYNTERYQ